MKTIKIIDLKKRTIYVDDIEQIYCDNSYIPERYNIQTTYGTYLVDKEDYFKVKDYLLSLNDEIGIIEEPKKIKKLNENNTNVLTNIIENRKKINEIIDKLNSMEK